MILVFVLRFRHLYDSDYDENRWLNTNRFKLFFFFTNRLNHSLIYWKHITQHWTMDNGWISIFRWKHFCNLVKSTSSFGWICFAFGKSVVCTFICTYFVIEINSNIFRMAPECLKLHTGAGVWKGSYFNCSTPESWSTAT